MPDPTQSRVRTPDPNYIALEGAKPSLKPVSTSAAGSDNVFCRPLGYRVKALTLVTPDSTYATGANTDSVYIDLEDMNIQPGVTPNSFAGPIEIPPGKAWTFEEVDPGWFHFGSPTANQRLFVTYGGPTPTPPSAK